MLSVMAILAILGTTQSPTSSAPWSPTNDPSVNYRWTLEPSWRPACNIRVMDTAASGAKRVSISYRNRSGSHIALSVRMNPADPQERLIAGCKMIDQVQITRP
jgi:hypothetical protein